MKQDGYWARSHQKKADTFMEHLKHLFISNIREMGPGEKEVVFGRRESTQSQTTEITRLTKNGIRIAYF